jgi:hypothetical protein
MNFDGRVSGGRGAAVRTRIFQDLWNGHRWSRKSIPKLKTLGNGFHQKQFKKRLVKKMKQETNIQENPDRLGS